ncbi:MAG TPA: hypothetical protein VK846_16820 [Candidatus Limnocylindria bacterium]|nr:hypothetical protein [Candidatus Limnocylindria bacterium]
MARLEYFAVKDPQGSKSAHFCSVKITEGVRNTSANKAANSPEKGAELYAKA